METYSHNIVLSAAILDSPNVEVTDILNVDWSGTIFSAAIPNSPKTALYGGYGHCVALNGMRIFLSADARRVFFNSYLNGEWTGWGRVDLTINHAEDGGYG